MSLVARPIADYFADKNDIMTSALRLSHLRIRQRWLETRLEISYWSRALGEEEDVLAVQRAEASQLYQLVFDLVADGRRRGEIAAGEEPAQITERLLALIDGLSLHALLYPDRLSASAQVALVDGELERLAVGRTAGTAGDRATADGG